MDDATEDAWLKGVAAGRKTKPRASNPFAPGSGLFLEWDGGWRAGWQLANQPGTRAREAWETFA